VTDGIVLPFRRPARLGGPPVPRPRPHAGLALVLQVVNGNVELLCDQVKLVIPPDMARELAQDMLELADDAEAQRGA
jgi:hypothetical protein